MNGTLQWTRQLGTSESDHSAGVSADTLGNVYISGSTSGSLAGVNAGGIDAFLSKYDENGTLQWTRQFGTHWDDYSLGVSTDGEGSVYISGGLERRLAGNSRLDREAFLSKYDTSGTLQWTRQLGTSSWDKSNGVSVDGQGSVFISGITQGSLGGTNVGHYDAFVAKYAVPEPATFTLLCLAIGMILSGHSRFKKRI